MVGGVVGVVGGCGGWWLGECGGGVVVPKWKWEKCEVGRIKKKLKEFLYVVPIPQNPTPFDFLSLYVTEEMVTLMVVETNRYAQQYIAANVNNLKPSLGKLPSNHTISINFRF